LRFLINYNFVNIIMSTFAYYTQCLEGGPEEKHLSPKVKKLPLISSNKQASAMDTLSVNSEVKSGHLPLDYNPFLPLVSDGVQNEFQATKSS
jgi:hypothetical protein